MERKYALPFPDFHRVDLAKHEPMDLTLDMDLLSHEFIVTCRLSKFKENDKGTTHGICIYEDTTIDLIITIS